jgi:hypothetical protein
MKKTILFVSALVILGLTSCKKDYTCNCATMDLDTEEITTESYTIQAGHKSEASIECDGGDYDGVYIMQDCEILE